jgi:hypothetical protein
MSNAKTIALAALLIAMPKAFDEIAPKDARITSPKGASMMNYMNKIPRFIYRLDSEYFENLGAIKDYILPLKSLRGVALDVSYTRTKMNMLKYIEEMEKSRDFVDNIVAYKTKLAYLDDYMKNESKEELERLKTSLSADYPGIMKKFDYVIPSIPTEHYRNEYIKLRDYITKKLMDEKIIH